MRFIYGVATVILFCFTACGEATAPDADPVLARVHQRELRLSELEGMFPVSATHEDSLVIIEAFTNRWARDAILLWESERYVPGDLNIDELVRDYRASLVRSSYEELLVSQQLDSTVTREQLETYYDTSKEQYQLEKPIVRCLFIRLPYPTPREDELQQLWNNGNPEDAAALEAYCRRYAEISLLDQEAWYSLDEIAAQLPEGTLTADNVNSKREFSQRDGTNRYYFRLFELKPRLEIAPLNYVENQARRVILHGRKREVLERAREDIFERELRRNNIELFTNR